MQRPDTDRQRAGILILVLGIGILLALAPFASGLLGVAVLYVIAAPAFRWLSRYISREKAAALVVAGAVLVIVLPGATLIGIAVDQAPDTLRRLQETDFFSRVATIRLGGLSVGSRVAEAGGTVVSWTSRQAFAAFGSAARGTLNLVVALFGLFYMLLSADVAWPWFRRYLPFSTESAELLRARFYSVTQATLLGTALTSVLQGLIVGVGFWLTGLASPVFWGVATAFASILPVVGSALVWLPGVAVLLVSQRFVAAIVLALIGGLLASNIDNLVRPVVYRRVSNIHPMITVVGAFAGLKYFGLLGLLLGPLAIFYFFELLRIFQLEYVAGLPDPSGGAGRSEGAGEEASGAEAQPRVALEPERRGAISPP